MIIGTCGHVDHGRTALVKALTISPTLLFADPVHW